MNTGDELFVVPAERHVERLALNGENAETRSSLRERLAVGLLPGVRFAEPREVRLGLAVALEEIGSRRGQLDLFGGGGSATDPLLAAMRARGGASWVRAVLAVDDALSALRRRGVTAEHLESVASGKRGTRSIGVASRRAAILAAAMRELDDGLARGGVRDARLLAWDLAAAIRAAGGAKVAELARATRLRARWILGWDLDELAWWRALDETLAPSGGYARVVLPAFDKRLEGERVRDPFEVLADAVARQLDAAPETETIPAVLGDLASVAPDLAGLAPEIQLLRASDSTQQASLVTTLVRDAIDRGANVERIVIAYPSRDERTLVPLRRALDEAGVVFFDPYGAPASTVPVVAAAFQALAIGETPSREAVARLLRSGYVDAPRLLGDPTLPFRDAERILARFARALETRATAAGSDDAERLVRTAMPRESKRADPSRAFDTSTHVPDAPPTSEASSAHDAGSTRDAPPSLRKAAAPEKVAVPTLDDAQMARVVAVLLAGRMATTRVERIRAARHLFAELGLGARAGRGALATFARDEAPMGVDRAERLAVARDVRAWEAFDDAIDAYEVSALRAPRDHVVDAEVFRLELVDLVDASARLTPLPSGGRAGAIRLAALADIAGEELDLLVVLDANEGVLPRESARITLVSDTLEEGLARITSRAIVRDPSERAARDLAALATSAAESARIAFVTTGESNADTPATPARVFVLLERAGLVPTTIASTTTSKQLAGSVARRVQRERSRELFFLDPSRPRSDVVGSLAPTPTIRTIVASETGDTPARALAVTSVERFAQCAFKGYAHVVLSAREGDEQHELPDAREEGNLGHAALAAAFTATSDEWSRRPRDAAKILERGLAAADEILAETAVHAPLRAIVRLRIRESVRAVLLRSIDDLDWNFAFAEQPFRQFEMGEASARLWVRGTIDRIDRAPQTAPAYRVIDYKRSKSTVRDATASLGKTALQVPIYAAVAARRFEAPATGAYLPMQPRDLALEPAKASARAEAAVSDLARSDASGRSPIEMRVLEVIAAARDAEFTPLPAREAECTYCSVSGGCRKPRFAMAPADEEETETP